MNEADLARLELARRAFKAAAPSDHEVQVAVRRARLALLRPRKTRSLAGKGLVVLVLAIGGLAYAKPQAVGELLGSTLPLSAISGSATPSRGRSAAPVPPPPAVAQQLANQAPRSPAAGPAAPFVTEQSSPPTQGAALAPGAGPARSAAKPAAAARTVKPAATASEWGNVAHALASGDEASALASLDNLSHSEDPRTRDKADLGRAQLLLSRGEQSSACALVRALLERPIDRQLERQARAFLNDCAR